MKNETLFQNLHTALNHIKDKLLQINLTQDKDHFAWELMRDITQVETAINQFPKMSNLQNKSMFGKKDEALMLEKILESIKAVTIKLNTELKKEEKTIEREMDGTKNYSDYENERLSNFAFKEELKKEFEKMISLIITEKVEPHEKTARPGR